jgi:hypothetical protein
MSVFVSLLLNLRDYLRSRAALQVEVLALRHHVQVLERSRPHRLPLTHADLHDSAAPSSVAGMARVLEEPRRPDHDCGFLRRPDGDLPPVVRADQAGSRSPTHRARRRHRQSDCDVDRPATARSVPMGHGASLRCDPAGRRSPPSIRAPRGLTSPAQCHSTERNNRRGLIVVPEHPIRDGSPITAAATLPIQFGTLKHPPRTNAAYGITPRQWHFQQAQERWGRAGRFTCRISRRCAAARAPGAGPRSTVRGGRASSAPRGLHRRPGRRSSRGTRPWRAAARRPG